MWTKVKAAFIALAVLLFAGLISRDGPAQSPGQAFGMLAMAGIALLILMVLVGGWKWLKRQLFKEGDQKTRQPAEAPPRRID